MSILVVANPAAKAAAKSDRDAVVSRLRVASPVEIVDTIGRGHAAEIVKKYAQTGSFDAIIALGGDGTVNEVVNGILSGACGIQLPNLGVLPAGGTNVFARALGFPNSVRRSADMLVGSIAGGHSSLINLGMVNGRYFTFSSGIGFDATVLESVERKRGVGGRSSIRMTVKNALHALFLTAWPELLVKCEGVAGQAAVRWLIAANCDPWTYVNERPLRPMPNASLRLGLDLYGRTRVNPFSVGFAAFEMMLRTSGLSERGVYRRHDVNSFTVSASEPVPAHVDGEFLGRESLYNYDTKRDAIRVFRPI